MPAHADPCGCESVATRAVPGPLGRPPDKGLSQPGDKAETCSVPTPGEGRLRGLLRRRQDTCSHSHGKGEHLSTYQSFP